MQCNCRCLAARYDSKRQTVLLTRTLLSNLRCCAGLLPLLLPGRRHPWGDKLTTQVRLHARRLLGLATSSIQSSGTTGASIYCRTSLSTVCELTAMPEGCDTHCCVFWRSRAAFSQQYHYKVSSEQKLNPLITEPAWLSESSIASLTGQCCFLCSVPAQLEHISTQLTSAMYTLADSGAVDPAVVTDTVSAKNGGFFGPLASVFETFLKVQLLVQPEDVYEALSCCLLSSAISVQILDQGLHGAGVPYSYGFAIILLTVLVKLATYPLSKQQVLPTSAGHLSRTLQLYVCTQQTKTTTSSEKLLLQIQSSDIFHVLVCPF